MEMDNRKEKIRKKTILVVEDNDDNREILIKYLTFHNFDVRGISSGKELENYLINFPKPDLILLDIKLKDCEGLSIAKKIKENAKFSSIPIIAITAYAKYGYKDKALQIGCIDYLAKPIDLKVLLDKVKKHI